MRDALHLFQIHMVSWNMPPDRENQGNWGAGIDKGQRECEDCAVLIEGIVAGLPLQVVGWEYRIEKGISGGNRALRNRGGVAPGKSSFRVLGPLLDAFSISAFLHSLCIPARDHHGSSLRHSFPAPAGISDERV